MVESKTAFSESGVRFEVARELLGVLIAHESHRIAQASDADPPRADEVEDALEHQGFLVDLQASLDPRDEAQIARVIEEYGPSARALLAT